MTDPAPLTGEQRIRIAAIRMAAHVAGVAGVGYQAGDLWDTSFDVLSKAEAAQVNDRNRRVADARVGLALQLAVRVEHYIRTGETGLAGGFDADAFLADAADD